MRSDSVKRGVERAAHRALLKALKLSDREIEAPCWRRLPCDERRSEAAMG